MDKHEGFVGSGFKDQIDVLTTEGPSKRGQDTLSGQISMQDEPVLLEAVSLL